VACEELNLNVDFSQGNQISAFHVNVVITRGQLHFTADTWFTDTVPTLAVIEAAGWEVLASDIDSDLICNGGARIDG
jgi:hypothetical protein